MAGPAWSTPHQAAVVANRRALPTVDGRAEESRLLKGIRKGILDHLGASAMSESVAGIPKNRC